MTKKKKIHEDGKRRIVKKNSDDGRTVLGEAKFLKDPFAAYSENVFSTRSFHAPSFRYRIIEKSENFYNAKLSISPGTLCESCARFVEFIRKAAKEEKRKVGIMQDPTVGVWKGWIARRGSHEIQNDRYDVIKILIRRARHARETTPGAGG
jgi:hypothetical protein